MFKLFKNKKIKINVDGETNIVKYPENAGTNLKDLQIFIGGNNNTVEIKTTKHFAGRIFIGTADSPASNCSVVIGADTTCNGADIWLMEDNSKVIIGSDVMLSDDIYITCSDTHSMLNENGELINIGKSVEIGNHVWVGRFVNILKNTKILDNSVIAIGSIVTKCFDEKNVVIAGNPAKIIKRNINWDRQRPNQILKNKG